MAPFDFYPLFWPLVTFALVLAGWFGLMRSLYKIAGR
jgi:hypothetical protein